MTRASYVFPLFGCTERPAAVFSLLAALQLLQETKPRHPILAMLTGSCCHDAALALALRDAGVNRTCVPPVDGISCAGGDRRAVFGSYRNQTYAKLHIWALTDYDVALSLDTDVAVMRSLDGVLDRMAADRTLREARSPQGCLSARDATHRFFNTGVWAVQPDAAVHAAFMRYLRSGHSRCYGGDQSAALGFFAGRRAWPVLPLHVGYNLKVDQGVRSCLDKVGLGHDELFVVHWAGPHKPVGRRNGHVRDELERKAHSAYTAAYEAAQARYASYKAEGRSTGRVKSWLG